MKLSQMFFHWKQVRADLLATIDKFSEDELTFAPFQGSWPAGQIMLHIADCEDNWLHGVVRGEFKPWIFYDLADYPTKASIKEVLHRAQERTTHFLACALWGKSLDTSELEKEYQTPNGSSFTLRWIIWHVLEHEIHHRGELSRFSACWSAPG